MDAVVPLVVGLAWPAITLIVLFKFHPQISSLVAVIEDKIRRSRSGNLSAGPVGLAWEDVVERSSKSLEELPPVITVSEARGLLRENISPAPGTEGEIEGARSTVREAFISAGALITPTDSAQSGDLLAPLAEDLLTRGKVGYAVVNAAYVLDDLYEMYVGARERDRSVLNEYLDLSAQLFARIPVEG